MADANQLTGTGKMMKAVSTFLTDYIQVGMTAPSPAIAAGTIATYSTALNSASGHGQPNGSFAIPLYANQTVETNDAAGSYSIVLNYTVTSSY